MGVGRARQTRRRAGDLLLPQPTTTVVSAGCLWKKREGESQQGRAQRNEADGSGPGGGVSGGEKEGSVNTKAKIKRKAKTAGRVAKKRTTVGARIIEGLEEAIAWTRGENDDVRVTLVHVPGVDVREVRTKMG